MVMTLLMIEKIIGICPTSPFISSVWECILTSFLGLQHFTSQLALKRFDWVQVLRHMHANYS